VSTEKTTSQRCILRSGNYVTGQWIELHNIFRGLLLLLLIDEGCDVPMTLKLTHNIPHCGEGVLRKGSSDGTAARNAFVWLLSMAYLQSACI
jgi:hypothetical protein